MRTGCSRREWTVGLLKDGTVRTLQFPSKKKPAKVPSTPIGLAPAFLMDNQELGRLERRLARKHSPFNDLTQRMKVELSNGHRVSVSDYGKVYVYEAWEGAYEVDVELTTMSRTTFEALALAIHLSRQKLLCHLVPPKARRKSNAISAHPATRISEPVTYGQLRLRL